MKHFVKSQRIFILTFVVLSLFGAIVLCSPFINHTDGISFIDALFTSTSAVCVTGLSTMSTSGFSMSGQLFLLMMMQIGAIGIMTLTSSILLFVRRQMGLQERLMISDINSTFSMKEVDGVLKVIITYTLISEALGAFFLLFGFLAQGLEFGPALYSAVFHSVSAFCNAGFSLYDDSLMSCNSMVKLTVSAMIILGSLGYYMVFDLFQVVKNRTSMKIHTKIVAVTTLILIFGGMFFIYILEGGQLGIVDSFFQSVTLRTAGFNSIDLTTLQASTIVIMLVLMIIGASPGSTGGGIKTTTAALMLFAIYNVFKGNRKFRIFSRRIPTENILRAFSITFTYFLVTIIATTALLSAQGGTLKNALFEVISALSTVGLSIGATADANTAGKVILILCMVIGRVGPFSLMIFLISHKEKESKLKYPEEKLILG